MQSQPIHVLFTLGLMLSAESFLARSTASELPYADTAAKLSQLSPEQQLQHLRPLLEERFNNAARIALPDAERERRSVRYAEVLKRLSQGKSLSQRGARRLLTEITSLEQMAVDQLSLQYRVRVYQRFRTDRSEYDRRMSAWRSMISSWEANAANSIDGAKPIAWLSAALESLRTDERAVLPPLPSFQSFAEQHRPNRSTKPQIDDSLPRNPSTSESVIHLNAPPDIKLSEPISKPAIDEYPGHEIAAPPSIAHHAQKPAIPEIDLPPRVIIRDVRPVIAPPEAPSTFDDSRVDLDPEPRVSVDLNELTVRIKGYNLALKDLTGSMHDDSVWTPTHLEAALDELVQLAERRAQLALYRDVISTDDQVQTGNLIPLDSAVALLGAKIFAAREQLAESDADSTSAELSNLNELSQKLAQLAAKRAK